MVSNMPCSNVTCAATPRILAESQGPSIHTTITRLNSSAVSRLSPVKKKRKKKYIYIYIYILLYDKETENLTPPCIWEAFGKHLGSIWEKCDIYVYGILVRIFVSTTQTQANSTHSKNSKKSWLQHATDFIGVASRQRDAPVARTWLAHLGATRLC